MDLEKSSVRRCLFGKPTESSNKEFTAKMKKLEIESALRFTEKWGFDVLGDSDNNNTSNSRFEWVRCSSDSDIPEVYKKGLPTWMCRKKPSSRVRGKAMFFMEGPCSTVAEDSRTTVPHFVKSTVELYIGLPVPSERNISPAERNITTTTWTNHADSEVCQTPQPHLPQDCYDSENVRPSARRQLRMTDLFRVKKRARSLSAESNNKRERR